MAPTPPQYQGPSLDSITHAFHRDCGPGVPTLTTPRLGGRPASSAQVTPHQSRAPRKRTRGRPGLGLQALEAPTHAGLLSRHPLPQTFLPFSTYLIP